MSELNITSGGGLRRGPGTAIKDKKIRALVSLVDSRDYIGTTSALAEQFGYSSTSTVIAAIGILRALGYAIKNGGRAMGYIVTKRPAEFPHGFEHFRQNGQMKIAISEAPNDQSLQKLPLPPAPKTRDFGSNVVLAATDWNEYICRVNKIYDDYSILVDLFNGNE